MITVNHHCNSLEKKKKKKHHSKTSQLQTSLEKKGVFKPPYGHCFICQSTSHWASKRAQNQNHKNGIEKRKNL